MARPRDPGRPLRVAVLSSLSRDSGGHLRAFYIAKHLRLAGAEVRFFPSVRALPLFLDYFVSAVLHMRAAFGEYDVLIAQKPLFNVALPLLLQRARRRLTVVDIDDDDSGFRTGPVSLLNALLQRPIPRRCTFVTYHAETLPARIRDVFAVEPARLLHLPQGVDLEIFSPAAARPRERGQPPTSAPTVIYPGHLNIASELEAVFRVLAIARQSLAELRLLVVGGGPLERRFRRLAREHGVADATTFTGHVSPSAVRDHVLSVDAGILYYEPRHANLFRESMKLREMLALGVPVVCNDVAELARFAPWTYQGATGYETVAAELVRLLRTGGDGRERAGMAYVRGNLGWPILGRRLYARLVRAVGGDIHEERAAGTNPADSRREHPVPAGTAALHDR